MINIIEIYNISIRNTTPRYLSQDGHKTSDN